MPSVLSILFGAALTVAVILAAGRLLVRCLRLKCVREEENVIAYACGAALLSMAVFILCAARLAYPGVFAALAAGVLLWAWRAGCWQPVGEKLPALSPYWRWLFHVPFVVYFALYLVHAMAPEYSPDGTAYHLALAARYLRQHGFAAVTTNLYANMPQGMDMLFLFAFAFGRHSASALVHFSFLAALALGLRDYGRRVGRPGAGVFASLLVFLAPVIAVDGTSAYNDVALAFVLFALFLLLQVQPRLGAVAGLLAGFAFGIKYTGFVALPYAAVESARLSRRWRQLPALVCAAALMTAPWLVKNWIIVRNPFAPFFNTAFPNPYTHLSFEREYGRMMRHYEGLRRYSDIPLEVTVRGRVLGGFFGPLWLLAPLALLALRRQAGRRVLAAAVLFGLPYAANIGTRFLIPAAPFAAFALGLALSGWRPLIPAAIAFHAVLSWPSIAPRYCERLAWRLLGLPIRAALRMEPEERFLLRRNSGYGAARMIDRLVPPGGRVFAFFPVPEAYTEREILIGFQGAENEVLRDILTIPVISERLPNGLLIFAFAPRPLRAVRAVQTGAAPPGGDVQWSVGEMRIYSAGRELARRPEWRIRARPNPWDVQMAFDNSAVTRWRSWQPMAPGMSLEADFGRPETAGQVVLEVSRDQLESKVKVEGLLENGHWELLSDPPQDLDGPPPLGLRRSATEELRRRGITHLLVEDARFAAGDFRAKARSWSITEIGQYSGWRLYRLD